MNDFFFMWRVFEKGEAPTLGISTETGHRFLPQCFPRAMSSSLSSSKGSTFPFFVRFRIKWSQKSDSDSQIRDNRNYVSCMTFSSPTLIIFYNTASLFLGVQDSILCGFRNVAVLNAEPRVISEYQNIPTLPLQNCWVVAPGSIAESFVRLKL